MLVDLTLPSGRIARREVPIDILDLPATRSTAGKRRPAPGEEPRGVAPRTRELPRGTISGEEGASSSAAVRSDGEASEASDAEGGDEAGGSVTEPPAARSSSDRGRAQSAASVARTRRDEAVFEAYAKLASKAAEHGITDLSAFLSGRVFENHGFEYDAANQVILKDIAP